MRTFAVLAVLGGLFLGNTALAQGWGTIKGQVVSAPGVPVAPAPLAITKDQAFCLKDGPIMSEDWVVNKKNGGLRHVFVWLAPVPGGPKLPVHPQLMALPAKAAELDQPCCSYVPRALAVREGQLLVAKNSAAVAHNVHYVGGIKNPGANQLVPAGGNMEIKLKADRFPVSFKCDIHPWMGAWVRVFDHPYYAVTDDNGEFTIKDAPAGIYHLIVWHELAGWVNGGKEGKPIAIKAGGETKVKLDAKPAN